MTNLANPEYASLPWFLGGGLVYEGLLPGRPRDLFGVAFTWGQYSAEAADAEERRGIKVHASREAVLESDYRVVINRWAYVAPFLQCIINPSGTGQLSDALVLGVNFRAEL
jgi:porin